MVNGWLLDQKLMCRLIFVLITIYENLFGVKLTSRGATRIALGDMYYLYIKNT